MINQYVELIEKDIKNRGNIVLLQDIKIYKSKHERYISHYRFDKDFFRYVTEKKTVADFSGAVSIDNIWVDFDKEDDIEGARTEAIKFIKQLAEMSSLNPSTFPAYFSGSKGFHVGINSSLINISGEFSIDLPDKIKKFVQAITKNIDCVDYSIYNKNRVIRLPFSVNKKSGLYKIYIPYKVFWGEPISNITEYAKDCKIFDTDKIQIQPNEHLIKIFEGASSYEAQSKKFDKDSTSLFSLPQNGQRNNTLFKQACKLFSTKGIKGNEATDIMRHIFTQTKNQNGKDFSPQEFNSLISSAMKTVSKNAPDKINIKPVDTLTFSVIDSIKNSRYIPTTVDEWDADLDGGLARGNLYSIIGKGGTKKSLLAMWMGIQNCMRFGMPIAYFNMEMSTTQSFIRAFRMLFNRDLKEEVKKGLITDEEAQQMGKEFNQVLKNKFYLIDNNNLSPSDMENVINDIGEDYDEKVALVVVDSMNSMASVGESESFTAFEITKQLKQLAKDKDVVVILINHITKGVSGHVRDVSLYVRGGEKIRDNCDAYFCLSQIINKEESTLMGEEKDYVYDKSLVYARFVNKRESGNTLDKVLELGPDLVPRALDTNPKDYEIRTR